MIGICNVNTLCVDYEGIICTYISYKFVCVCVYKLFTWSSFGLLKGLVVLSFALSNFRIKVPTDCTVIGG